MQYIRKTPCITDRHSQKNYMKVKLSFLLISKAISFGYKEGSRKSLESAKIHFPLYSKKSETVRDVMLSLFQN